jgi:hypothetical protein
VQNSPLELDSNNQKSELLVKKYIGSGYKLKKEQINNLILNNHFYNISKEFHLNSAYTKKILRETPTIGRLTYKSLCEFLANQSTDD